jgi:DNA primase
MFPIHNLSGRTIGFGGRTLSTDKTKPKYVNSPESEIYHKSNVLYGIFFAKNAIIAHDNCYLVEGYTDVISIHIAGIENVVASSGTSLTTEQVKLIRRYTPNITILYDGDAAGIKASFRGIDMILEEGMNVKIVLFPDGEDPDSYSRKHRPAEVRDFIQHNAFDFITFKTNLLIGETANDPVKKASLIKEIVGSIALIPDAITRSVYTRECSSSMKVPEQMLINELNKLRRKKSTQRSAEIADEQDIPEPTEYTAEPQVEILEETTENQEKELLKFLFNYGNRDVEVDMLDEDGEKVKTKMSLAAFIVMELQKDKMVFQNPLHQAILEEYEKLVQVSPIPDVQYFVNHSNPAISAAVIELLFNPYELSGNWKIRHRISVALEDANLMASAVSYIYSLKLKKVDKMMAENLDALKKATNEEDEMILIQRHNSLMEVKREFAKKLTRIVTK